MAATKMIFHHMVLIFHSFKGFSDLDLDMEVFQILKTSVTAYLSERFGKFLCLIFLHLVFNQMVLIFHLDMFFRSGVDFERFMGSLLESLLKYNAVEVF
ncbi:hypothetical protein DY000_02038352 [Brassica cretica]|uniref:Uncharacterized protein n=1 Tax=Brassica cretica TaxID=69181 RepID=A0ABQ7BNE8_BRACR|nr:hypothetical protein DY000_02038352 [Brassica cretica]